jgi:hypothetical protein
MNPLPPTTVKRILESVGYELISTDDCCWMMLSNGHLAVIPQTMTLVPVDVLESIFEPAGIDEKSLAQLLEGKDSPPTQSATAK